MHRESIRQPEKFWAREARELTWQRPWKKVLEWKPPFAKWFVGGKLNVAENCLDRHLQGPRRNKAAIIWEGEPGDKRILTYQQLHRDVCRFANVLKRNKIRKGDRVIIYMPTIPEAAIAMLACARIGAVHSVVFGGFSADSIRDRIADCGAIAVITADGGYRRGAIVPLKHNVDEALKGETTIKRVIVFRRAGNDIHIEEGRDVWWHRELEYVDAKCPPAALDSEHPLYILYTSGSTGKPKGILHTTGGYLVGIHTSSKYVFDLREDDIYWCTADVGWVTGHSYVVYGPLAAGATTLMYEGAPNWPEPDRFWRIIEDYAVSILYTAPTAIRAFIRWGDQWVKKARSLVPAIVRHSRRADQSRGLDVVSRNDRRRALPDRRYLVADRDRRDHDHPVAGRDPDETRQRDAALLRCRSRGGRCGGQGSAAQRRRQIDR